MSILSQSLGQKLSKHLREFFWQVNSYKVDGVYNKDLLAIQKDL